MADVTNEKLLALPGGLVTPNSASQAWCEFLLSLTPPEDQQRPPPSLVFVALAVLSGRSRLLRPSCAFWLAGKLDTDLLCTTPPAS